MITIQDVQKYLQGKPEFLGGFKNYKLNPISLYCVQEMSGARTLDWVLFQNRASQVHIPDGKNRYMYYGVISIFGSNDNMAVNFRGVEVIPPFKDAHLSTFNNYIPFDEIPVIMLNVLTQWVFTGYIIDRGIN